MTPTALVALAADAVLVLHAMFIGWVVFGGLAVLRWPNLAWWHLPALAWGLWISASGGLCPLTPLEQQLRLSAGQAGYAGGFIAHHLAAWIYPQGLTRGTQAALPLALFAFNACVYARWWSTRSRSQRRTRAHLNVSAPGAARARQRHR